MNTADFQKALHGGKRLYGSCVTSPSPVLPAFLKETAVDFVFLDTEHMPLDREKLSFLCRLYKAEGILPLVRILSPDPYLASRAIDAGAAGIIAPYIETAEQVKALRGAVKLRPLKGEKMQRILDGEAMTQEMRDYTADYSNYLLIINIESAAAVRNLDEMLAVPQVDALLIGPHDLSCNLDIPEQYHDPRFLDAVQAIVSKARAKQVGAGMHYAWSVEDEIRFARMGVNLLIHSNDALLFAESMQSYIQAVEEAFHNPCSGICV